MKNNKKSYDYEIIIDCFKYDKIKNSYIYEDENKNFSEVEITFKNIGKENIYNLRFISLDDFSIYLNNNITMVLATSKPYNLTCVIEETILPNESVKIKFYIRGDVEYIFNSVTYNLTIIYESVNKIYKQTFINIEKLTKPVNIRNKELKTLVNRRYDYNKFYV